MQASQTLDLDIEQLTDEAVRIISSQGPCAQSLAHLGKVLSQFAQNLGRIDDHRQEKILRTETDGTFELVIKNLSEHTSDVREHTYDTWAVYAPIHGLIRHVSGDKKLNTILQPGAAVYVMAGDYACFQAHHDNAQMVCLFGIARQYLPPPRMRQLKTL